MDDADDAETAAFWGNDGESDAKFRDCRNSDTHCDEMTVNAMKCLLGVACPRVRNMSAFQGTTYFLRLRVTQYVAVVLARYLPYLSQKGDHVPTQPRIKTTETL